MTDYPETETIARIMAGGYNRHVRDHGPDGDYAGEAVETGDGHGVIVSRGGAPFSVQVTRSVALTAAAPLTPGQCWAALKDYLDRQIDQDLAVHEGALADGDLTAATAHGALVSANRGTLAKMRELEG